MSSKKILQFIARFAIPIIVILFIYNIYSHGTIIHPGKALFKAQCSQCHGEDGEGIKALVPPLQNSDYAARNLDSIPCWLKFGMNHPVRRRAAHALGSDDLPEIRRDFVKFVR